MLDSGVLAIRVLCGPLRTHRSDMARKRSRPSILQHNSTGRPRREFPGYRPNASTSEPFESDVTDFAKTVAAYFTNERFRYVKELGGGLSGQAVLVQQRDELNLLVRNLAVKFSHSRLGDEDLRAEAGCLKKLRGAAHIVQAIAMRDVPVEPSGNAKGKRLSRPVLVTECLQNGTIEAFIDRAEFGLESVPNRILWAIFLCRKDQPLDGWTVFLMFSMFD